MMQNITYLVDVSDFVNSSTSKARKKDGKVFYHIYKRFFIFRIKNAFSMFFIFFPTFITTTGF